MPFETGPYLKAAIFCEKVLKEADGVASLIRIVDRLIVSAQGPGAPDTMPETPFQMNAVIMLTSGAARGRHEIKVIPEEPSGLKTEPFMSSVLMEGEDKGQNIIINMRINFKEEGLYWYHVYLNDTLLTKMPFRVIYGRVSTGAPKTRDNP